jgi:hypothetical protein
MGLEYLQWLVNFELFENAWSANLN